MPSRNGHPLIARGPLVAWDREFQARRAVAEEEGEIARMQAEAAANVQPQSAQVLESVVIAAGQETGPGSAQCRDHIQALKERMREIEHLHRERTALIASMEQQARQLADCKTELESLRRFTANARSVMVDLMSSRGYCIMRLLGRWDTLDKGIRRALR